MSLQPTYAYEIVERSRPRLCLSLPSVALWHSRPRLCLSLPSVLSRRTEDSRFFSHALRGLPSARRRWNAQAWRPALRGATLSERFLSLPIAEPNSTSTTQSRTMRDCKVRATAPHVSQSSSCFFFRGIGFRVKAWDSRRYGSLTRPQERIPIRDLCPS
jgi:hypothetical protein